MGCAGGLVNARGAQTEGGGSRGRGVTSVFLGGSRQVNRGRGSGDRHGVDERSHSASLSRGVLIFAAGWTLIEVCLHSSVSRASCSAGMEGM